MYIISLIQIHQNDIDADPVYLNSIKNTLTLAVLYIQKRKKDVGMPANVYSMFYVKQSP